MVRWWVFAVQMCLSSASNESQGRVDSARHIDVPPGNTNFFSMMEA